MKTLKILSLFLATAISVSVFSGCTKKEETSQVVGNVDYKSMWATEKPKTFTIHYSHTTGGPFKDDYPVFKKASEFTNVSLKGTVPLSNSDHEQAFNTMMVSGELSDIVVAKKNSFEKYASVGAFLELDELIDKYAPNIKKFFEENPTIKKNILTSNGKIYFIPNVLDGKAAAGWFIRKDWLDKLGLSVPKTIEEYHNALLAFRNGDPNGNGQKDEIPYFDRNKSIKSILALYGVREGWVLNEDGTVTHSKFTKEYKEAVKNAAKWYKEGIIDQEIYTRGKNAREQLLGENLGGSNHDWFTSTTVFNERLKDKIQKFNHIAIAPPTDINGKVWEDTSRDTVEVYGWGIAKSNPDPIATIKYFDFWFSQEGSKLYNFGIENEQYTLVDGKPIFKPEFINGGKTMTNACWDNGMQLMIGAKMNFNYEKQWMNSESQKAIDMYEQNNYILPTFPSLSYNVEEQKVMTEKWAPIFSRMVEMEQNWVLGNASVDTTFDTYINDLNSLGIKDVIAVQNSAYQRYKAQ